MEPSARQFLSGRARRFEAAAAGAYPGQAGALCEAALHFAGRRIDAASPEEGR